jgi:hypothetical protein
VADSGNHRVVRFDENQTSASVVIGQKTPIAAITGTGLHQLNAPLAVAVDPQGCPWIADTGNQRVVRHVPDAPVITGVTQGPSKITLTCLKEPGVTYRIESSTNLVNWAYEGAPNDDVEEFTYGKQFAGSRGFLRVTGP